MSSTYSVSLQLQAQQALQALKNLTAGFKKLDGQVDKTDSAIDRFEKGIKAQGAKVKNTNQALTQYIDRLKRVRDVTDRSTRKFKILSAEIQKFEARLDNSRGKVNGLATALASLGVGFTLKRISGAIAGVGLNLTQAQAAVETLSGGDFRKVQKDIDAVVASSKNLTNSTEANAAAYEALSAGVSTVDLKPVLEASTLLAAADPKGATDQALAIDGLTTPWASAGDISFIL